MKEIILSKNVNEKGIKFNKKRFKNILTKVGVGAAYIVALNILQATNVFAADDPITVVNNL